MKELVQFYKTFLSDRQLDKFDGRILCRYQMSNYEFLVLENLLKRITLVNPDNLTTIIAPLFVLYTSESWRRNFSGAHWTWITVLNNLNQGDLRNIRYKYVKNGFRFLKRELRETEHGTRYLGSIAIESGIPIQILENEQNNLTGVIKNIFESLENTISNKDPIDLVENIALNRLPKTYHNDRFFLLLYDFSKALQSLSIKYKLEDQNNPMAYLDQNHPDWTNELPIVISQQNKNFFNTLLSDVAEITRTINNKLNVNYYLKNNNGTNSIHYNVTLKKGVYLPEVLGITQEDFKRLPNRFILVKNQGDAIIHIGYFDKIGNGEKFRVENLANNDVAVSFNEDTFYYLSGFDDNIKIDLNLNTVDFKNNDTPLIFINDKNQWKLKSAGSSKLIESTYKVLCVNDCVISEGIELPFNAPNYKLFELNKEVSLTNNDGSVFKITFSQTLDCNRFELLRVNSGLKFAENQNNSIFVGFPHLLKYNSNGRYLGRFRTGDLQVFINNIWEPVDNALSICGRVKVRLCLNEITEFSSWINVLPTNFEFNILQNKGEITLKNLPLNSSITVENKNFEINNNTLIYSKNIPGYTKLILQSEKADKPVIIKLPLPVQGSFFTKQGELLDNKSSLSINQLKGLRLCVFNLSNRSANKTVQIKLQKSGITSSKRYLIEAYGSKEISLLNLQDEFVRLFSIENSPDSIITLESDNQTLVIRKYSSAPYFCDDNKGYKFPINNTKVNIFRLDQDFLVEKTKEVFINQETQLLENEPNEGIYFIFSPDESENYFRPIALIKNVEPVNFDDNTNFDDWSFSEISKINDVNDSKRGYQLRKRAIKQRLKTIAYDYSNEEWSNNIIPLSEY
ncbi:MAG: STY4851/ECs_5259 family protein, partial [Ferruginibacter sp.]